MQYNFSIISHIVMGLVTTGTAWHVYRSYRWTKNDLIRYFLGFEIFLAIFSFGISAPFLWFLLDAPLVLLIYAGSIFVFFLGLASMIRLVTFFEAFQRMLLRDVLSLCVIIVGVAVFILNMYFGIQPRVDPLLGGVILWDAALWPRYLTGVSGLFVGSIIGVVFWRELLRGHDPVVYWKSALVSISGFTLGAGSFLYFPSETGILTVLGLVLGVLGFFAAYIGLVYDVRSTAGEENLKEKSAPEPASEGKQGEKTFIS